MKPAKGKTFSRNLQFSATLADCRIHRKIALCSARGQIQQA